MAGPARLRLVCEEFTRALAGTAALDLRIHTNGLQLSPRYLDLFAEYGVRVGISLDGDREANDRHRRFADGRTSHPLVLAAVALLRSEPYRHLYQGLLCTVDVANDPVAVLDALVELEPPRVDFLLPHATWQTPPVRPDGAPDAYARWLLRVFDRWEQLGRPVPVRLFESLLSTLRGGPSLTESLGLAPTDLVVVETDGTLEQVDSLKSAFEGARPPGSTSSTTPSTWSRPIPGCGPGSWGWRASAVRAGSARSYARAGAGSTPTGTRRTRGPAGASTTPPSTAPTCANWSTGWRGARPPGRPPRSWPTRARWPGRRRS